MDIKVGKVVVWAVVATCHCHAGNVREVSGLVTRVYPGGVEVVPQNWKAATQFIPAEKILRVI